MTVAPQLDFDFIIIVGRTPEVGGGASRLRLPCAPLHPVERQSIAGEVTGRGGAEVASERRWAVQSRGPVVGPSPDEQAQQDLEDMRAELLHEIQDGDEAKDEQVEAVSLQVARVRRWPGKRARALQTIPAT
jgi:hypothetical protein